MGVAPDQPAAPMYDRLLMRHADDVPAPRLGHEKAEGRAGMDDHFHDVQPRGGFRSFGRGHLVQQTDFRIFLDVDQ